jgi:hypothetical protein
MWTTRQNACYRSKKKRHTQQNLLLIKKLTQWCMSTNMSAAVSRAATCLKRPSNCGKWGVRDMVMKIS